MITANIVTYLEMISDPKTVRCIHSLPPDPERIAKAIRGHWQIENQCHWVSDVVFGEDQTTVAEGNAPENMRTINLLAAKMLKEEKTCKKGGIAKQFKTALDNGYLTKVLLSTRFWCARPA